MNVLAAQGNILEHDADLVVVNLYPFETMTGNGDQYRAWGRYRRT